MPAFWFHYNRPASLQRGQTVLTVHYRGRCLMVNRIDCRVPIVTRERKTQPRLVLAGRGVVEIADGVALISKENQGEK